METNNDKTDEKSLSIEESIKKALLKRVDDFLKTIHTQSGTVGKIYESGKTGALLRERGTTLETFRTNLSRMRRGIGVLMDPVLLTAILEDTSYPAQGLFSDETIPSINMNMVLGPGTVNSLERIIYKAVQDAQTLSTRIAKIEKRLEAAKKINNIVSMLIYCKNFSMAFFFLFLDFSKNNEQFYRHLEDKRLSHINNLLEHICNNFTNNTFDINNSFGKLLSLSYISFEITRICYSFINYGDKKERKTLSSKAKYEGFRYPENFSKKELINNIKNINKIIEMLISYILKNGNIIFTDDNVIIYSNQLLFKLLQNNINYPYFSELITGEGLKKSMLFSSNKSLNKKISIKRFYCEIDNNFISLIDNINKSLSFLLNNNNIIDSSNIADNKGNKKSIFAKSYDNSESDDIDDSKDDDSEDDINSIIIESFIEDEFDDTELERGENNNFIYNDDDIELISSGDEEVDDTNDEK